MPLIQPKSKKSLAKTPEPDSSLAVAYSVKRSAGKKSMAKGGEVTREPHPADLMLDDERADSIADAIMRKRKENSYAEGGQVDLEENAEETPANHFDELLVEATGETDPAPVDTKTNVGDEDLISKIRKSMKARRPSQGA